MFNNKETNLYNCFGLWCDNVVILKCQYCILVHINFIIKNKLNRKLVKTSWTTSYRKYYDDKHHFKPWNDDIFANKKPVIF